MCYTSPLDQHMVYLLVSKFVSSFGKSYKFIWVILQWVYCYFSLISDFIGVIFYPLGTYSLHIKLSRIPLKHLGVVRFLMLLVFVCIFTRISGIFKRVITSYTCPINIHRNYYPLPPLSSCRYLSKSSIFHLELNTNFTYYILCVSP